MNIDEFRNALRILLNDAIAAGLSIDDILGAADDPATAGAAPGEAG